MSKYSYYLFIFLYILLELNFYIAILNLKYKSIIINNKLHIQLINQVSIFDIIYINISLFSLSILFLLKILRIL